MKLSPPVPTPQGRNSKSTVIEEIMKSLIDFELDSGWHGLLNREESTNVQGNVSLVEQIKREYTVESNVYVIIVDIQRLTVELFSRSIHRGKNMALELCRRFEPKDRNLYNILMDHAQDKIRTGILGQLSFGAMSNDLGSCPTLEDPKRYEILPPGFCVFDWAVDDSVYCNATHKMAKLPPKRLANLDDWHNYFNKSLKEKIKGELAAVFEEEEKNYEEQMFQYNSSIKDSLGDDFLRHIVDYQKSLDYAKAHQENMQTNNNSQEEKRYSNVEYKQLDQGIDARKEEIRSFKEHLLKIAEEYKDEQKGSSFSVYWVGCGDYVD